MIIRILGEGQWRVDKAAFTSLNELDERVARAVAYHDQEALSRALNDLVERVTCHGEPVEDDELVASELILPDPSSTWAEIEALLASDELSDQSQA